MLAVVKTPRTEISLSGEAAEEILAYLGKKYKIEIVSTAVAEAAEAVEAVEDDGDELINIFETEWYQKMKHRLLAGARLKRGMTQKELAKKSGISQSVISEFEHGKRAMTMKSAIKLAEALGTKPERLMPFP